MKWLLLIALVASLGLTGCTDEKEELVINPDGSGKMFYNINYFTNSYYTILGIHSNWKDAFEKDMKNLLDSSQGIDTWKDVSYKAAEGDIDCDKTYYRVHIEATAYFSDINKVKLHRPEGGSKKLEFEFTRAGDQIIIAFVQDEYGSSKKNTTDPNLTEEQIDDQIKKIKTEWQEGMIEYQQDDCNSFALKNIKLERVLHLPGKIVESSNFTQVDGNTVRLYVDFDEAIKAMDLKMRDDAYLRAKIKKGEDPVGFNDSLEANEMMLGEAKPVSVTFELADRALFDYQAEMQAAKAKFPAMRDKLYSQFDKVINEQLGIVEDKKTDVNDCSVE